MAITLGTNIPSLTARTNLSLANNSLTETMERLSTGLKINRAGDDAAGLVISENMEALIRGSKQAMQNIQNAESFLTVAEDGMVSISDHYQRINDLLINMANDSNDTDSRTAAVQEIVERLDEIDRLAESTNFNGRTMLDGTVTSIIIQMGPGYNEDLDTLDISGALTDCHIATMDTELPEELDPSKPNKFKPTNENCRKFMEKIQAAIDTIATKRGLLGAYENRMESSYDSLSIRVESLETAKSLYTDADIAEEATNLTSQQIMQQLNISVLSIANSLQQSALSLLGA